MEKEKFPQVSDLISFYLSRCTGSFFPLKSAKQNQECPVLSRFFCSVVKHLAIHR
jgi:hypothetical protein